MRIFFSGGTGVIGRRTVPLLLARGHTVTVAIRNEAARERIAKLGASSAIVDLFEPATLRAALVEHDVLVNLATHIPSSTWRMMLRQSWRENDRIRSTGVRNLVDAALESGVRRIIQESFGLTYPDRGDAWIDETTRLEPIAYTRTVLDAEVAIERFASQGGAGVVLRFAGFYGPDAIQVKPVIAGVRHGWSVLPGSRDAFISSVSHDDAAQAVVAALEADSGAYNVSDDEPLSHAEYLGSLADALGVSPPRFLPAWSTPLFGNVGALLARSLRLSNRKLREATGWRPRYPSMREAWPALLTELAEAARNQRREAHATR
jgi:nucleoside-diphosphate-sugar epimerase